MADTRTIVKAEYANDINVRTADDDQKYKCCISGSAILSSNKLVVCDRLSDSIKEVDVKQARVVRQMKLSSSPWDVAAIDENTAAVTLNEMKVVFVTVGASIVVDKYLSVEGPCKGIDYRDGKLAVSFVGTHEVKVMDLEGTVLHNITNGKAGRIVLNNPNYVAFHPDGTSLYVSNYCSYDVVCINMDGTVTASYKDSELRGPSKVVADRRGNIYVCGDESDNIHQLTPDCKKIRVLLAEADGLRRPFTISYNETDNTLFVGMYLCGVVKVFKTVLG